LMFELTLAPSFLTAIDMFCSVGRAAIAFSK
jgi:hypothetical protein